MPFSIAAFACSTCNADPVELATFKNLHRPAPTAEIQYGPGTMQSIDLFIPSGTGPFPVTILIHGGCWRNLPGAGREQLRHLGADLAKQGTAVWSIGYRRADEEGGGYPGTFQDVATAIDRLQSEADRYQLDLSRTVMVGHSAGGHLALWAASRDQLPESAPLRDSHPFVPASVISLAGIGDLKSFARFVPVLCGPGIIERLAPQNVADPYAEISPAQLPLPRSKVLMISGVLDRLVPPYVADDYARSVRRNNVRAIELLNIEGAGHFDLVTPSTHAWDVVSSRIREFLLLVPQVSVSKVPASSARAAISKS
jgi:acetyl esterase/lipase